MMLWGFAGPSAQSLMSRRVTPHEQGQLQGAQSSLRGIGGLIGWQVSDMLGLSFASNLYLSEALVGALIGLSIGFWEPARHVEAVRKPFCLASLGGIDLDPGISAPAAARSFSTC